MDRSIQYQLNLILQWLVYINHKIDALGISTADLAKLQSEAGSLKAKTEALQEAIGNQSHSLP